MLKEIKHKKFFISSIIVIICSILLFLLDIQEPLDKFIYSNLIFNDTLTFIFKGITLFGNATILIFVLLLLVFYHKRKKNLKEGVYFITFTTVSYFISLILKILFQRERPNIKQLIEISGFSFPSGHAYLSTIVYGYMIYLISKNYIGKYKKIYTSLLILLVILIGISRIYLGVHYATDIIFGHALGLLSILLFITYLEKLKK